MELNAELGNPAPVQLLEPVFCAGEADIDVTAPEGQHQNEIDADGG